jgi:glucosylceramidase
MEGGAAFADDTNNQERFILNLYPEAVFQTIKGFGGAFTEAAGYVFSRLPELKQAELLDAYFGKHGLHYTLGRASIDSCDFSLGNYSAVTDPGDRELATFSLKRDEQYVLPLIKRAMALEPGLQMMLSPWSPPAFMKTNGQKNGGGKLLPEYREMWAKYMCRYVKEYEKRGIPVFALSVQNEPNAVQAWDSCIYSPGEELAFLRHDLIPAKESAGLDNIALTVWDHNKERLYDRTAYLCADEKARKAIGAAGFHWYSGDHFEAVELVSRQFPDKLLIFTEGCIEYSRFQQDSALKHAQMYAHEIIGSLNAGMHAFLDWNLLLTLEGGPNHAGNYCDAPVMADIKTGELNYRLCYFYLGHFSRHIRPGARRIGFTRYTDELEGTAFQNPGGQLVCVLLNRNAQLKECFLRLKGRLCKIRLPGRSIQTVLVEKREYA